MKTTSSAKTVAAILAIVIGVVLLITIPINLAADKNVKMAVIAGVLGALLIYMGIRTKMTVKKYKEYAAYLAEDPTGSIEKLAAKTGESVDEVRDNLQRMIERRYLIGARIDEEKNSIVLSNRE